MVTRFGIENLRDVDGNLEELRRNSLKLIDHVQMWQAVAQSSMSEFDFDFRPPHCTFSIFTDFIGVAAKELLQKPIPRMKEFADMSAGKKISHSHQGPTPQKKKTQTPVVSFGRSHSWSPSEDDYYTGHMPDEAPCVPGPADLQQALSEAEGLIDALLALPVPTVPARDSHAEN